MMASSSGMNIKEGTQHMNSSSSCTGNNSIGGRDSSSPTSFQQNQVSMDWTPDEQIILEEGLIKYASESSLSRYAKIAIQLKNKTVRDVALRCKWTTKKEISKRRKDDANLLKKNKDRKEKLTDPVSNSPPVLIQPGYAPYAQEVVSNENDGFRRYSATVNVTTQLIHQNARIFEQISANHASHQFQIQENTRLLCQARDNILNVLTRLNESSYILKQMPPLPVKLNEELANSILPSSTYAMG